MKHTERYYIEEILPSTTFYPTPYWVVKRGAITVSKKMMSHDSALLLCERLNLMLDDCNVKFETS